VAQELACLASLRPWGPEALGLSKQTNKQTKQNKNKNNL
jgi:hypothetical protein